VKALHSRRCRCRCHLPAVHPNLLPLPLQELARVLHGWTVVQQQTSMAAYEWAVVQTSSVLECYAATNHRTLTRQVLPMHALPACHDAMVVEDGQEEG